MAEVGCLAIPGFLFHDTPEMVRPGDAHGSPGTECHRAAFNQGPRNRYGQSPDSVSRALRFLGAALVTQFPKEKALHYGGAQGFSGSALPRNRCGQECGSLPTGLLNRPTLPIAMTHWAYPCFWPKEKPRWGAGLVWL